MANKTWNYNTAGDYQVSDVDKVEIADGVARLKEDLSNVYARWHLNESSGSLAADSSDNGRNGTLVNMEDGDWAAGKLNNCLEFNNGSSNEYIDCGNIANFERTDTFSLECWFKTNVGTLNTILGNCLAPNYKGYAIYLFGGGKFYFYLGNNVTSNCIRVITVNTFNDNVWHHVIVTYDGSSNSSGVTIYIDNTVQAVTVNANNLTDTALSSEPLRIGRYANSSDYYAGFLDEVVVYDRVLTSSEVAYRYNSGNGREKFIYYDDSPYVQDAGAQDLSLAASLDSFTETLGGGNEGGVGYNLSDDSGSIWKYWNGSAWVSGGSTSNYNTYSTVHTNIDDFPKTANFRLRRYLISDGSQQTELDENQLTYSTNQQPIINAGTNKSCYDHQAIAPFSDCTFSDPDGVVIKAEYKVDGEVDTWTEIGQGDYGTLQEAVQAWTYIFDNTGTKTVRLQVADDDGAVADDSASVAVNKYTVVFNVKDAAGNHLAGISFKPCDGSGWQTKNSPFTYEYEYGVTPYTAVFDKPNFLLATAEVISSNHTENVTLNYFIDKQNIAEVFTDYFNVEVEETSGGKIKKYKRGTGDCQKTIEVTYENGMVRKEEVQPC